MSHTPQKPNAYLRTAVAQEHIVFVSNERAKRLRTKTLEKTVDYYESILECLCGEQVWQILESLTAVEQELKSRQKHNLYCPVRKELFHKLHQKEHQETSHEP
jgi:hypothetical protein